MVNKLQLRKYLWAHFDVIQAVPKVWCTCGWMHLLKRWSHVYSTHLGNRAFLLVFWVAWGLLPLLFLVGGPFGSWVLRGQSTGLSKTSPSSSGSQLPLLFVLCTQVLFKQWFIYSLHFWTPKYFKYSSYPCICRHILSLPLPSAILARDYVSFI